MSDYTPHPARVVPVQPPRRGGAGRVFLWLFLLLSLGANALLCAGLIGSKALSSAGSGDGSLYVTEKTYSGKETAANKIAVVKIDGTLAEGMLGFAHKQIEEAARDKTVKAVVVRIESPGGTITASEDLLQRLMKLRDGTTAKFKDDAEKAFPKPLVVSMGNLCASGGYYIAMAAGQKDPADVKLFAETTTITGSIGVYASIPNVHKLANDHGVKMYMVKAGDIKGAGSLFHELSPQERQQLQDMVEVSYGKFTTLVENGRPGLKGKMTEKLFQPDKEIAQYDDRGNVDEKAPKVPYNRKRADGGIFTAEAAKEFGLVDKIGTVDDAVLEVAKQANNLGDYKVVQYERPVNLLSALSGNIQAPVSPAGQLAGLAHLTGPRVWLLTPGSELRAIADLSRGPQE